MRWIAFAGLLLSLVPGAAMADSADYCFGDTAQFRQGFLALARQLGPAMGEAITCEYADPNGTGDTLQQTTTGLAFYRKNTNTPTFTDGWNHWGQTGAGLVYWTGSSIDPP